jgi:hypothetical protein
MVAYTVDGTSKKTTDVPYHGDTPEYQSLRRWQQLPLIAQACSSTKGLRLDDLN